MNKILTFWKLLVLLLGVTVKGTSETSQCYSIIMWLVFKRL